MQHFSTLITALDQSNRTTDKLEALCTFFKEATAEDRVWALALFTGKRPKRAVNATQLRTWAAEAANLPDWLFEESYQVIGDLAETVSLLIIEESLKENSYTLSERMAQIDTLRSFEEEERKTQLIQVWKSMERMERFVFTKLITGGFRVGVSENLVKKAVAMVENIATETIAHRLMGKWNPLGISYTDLIKEERKNEDLSLPYPFCLAHPLGNDPINIGDPRDWQVEWKWDGIRGQLIKRGAEIHLWTRGGEPAGERFPEIIEAAQELPDMAIDGEILAFGQKGIRNFGVLQQRINRKKPSAKLMTEVPVIFMAYDILEKERKDLRKSPLYERRALLESSLKQSSTTLWISPLVHANTWNAYTQLHKQSREQKAEGFMLKHKSSIYHAGRKRGDWWKWKVDPYSIDAVLIYAQKGHGRRADLYTDYTLGIWHGDRLVPFAKAYSGLTDAELRAIDKFIKKNTLERFGPVRTVRQALVFEIAFEGIQRSNRHKCGVAVRFPRILRWRQDKKIEEANTLEDLKALL